MIAGACKGPNLIGLLNYGEYIWPARSLLLWREPRRECLPVGDSVTCPVRYWSNVDQEDRRPLNPVATNHLVGSARHGFSPRRAKLLTDAPTLLEIFVATRNFGKVGSVQDTRQVAKRTERFTTGYRLEGTLHRPEQLEALVARKAAHWG